MTASNRPRPAVTFRTMWAVAALSLGCAHGPLRPEASDSYGLSEAAGHRLSRQVASSEPVRSSRGPSESDAREAEVAENLRLGHLEVEAGRLDQAVRFYERVLRDDPDNAVAHHRLAVIADQTQDFAAAERHYLTVLEARPRDADVLNDLGYSYFLQRRYPESERVLREALASAPDHERALTNLGMLYGTIGDVGRAMAVLRLTGSEEEARAKLAALLPGSRPSPATGVATGAVPDRAIVQTAELTPKMLSTSSPRIAASEGDETQDLMRQVAMARQTAVHGPSQPVRRMTGRLPGLIEPAPGPSATASEAVSIAEAKPYIRGDVAGEFPQSVRPAAESAANLPSQVYSASLETSVSGNDVTLPLWTPPAPEALMPPRPAAGTPNAHSSPSIAAPAALPSPAYAGASPFPAVGPGGHSTAPTPLMSRSAIDGMP